MKKYPVRFFSLALLCGAALCTAALADTRADFAARGAKLFADTGLGTNGKSCASCHGDGKAWAGKPRFPKAAGGGMRTLDQALQICVVSALGGKPLAWDDERLSALAVFVDGTYAPAAR